MFLYKRFLLFIVAAACVAGAICGILIARDNTERRLYGNRPTAAAIDQALPTEKSPNGPVSIRTARGSFCLMRTR